VEGVNLNENERGNPCKLKENTHRKRGSVQQGYGPNRGSAWDDITQNQPPPNPTKKKIRPSKGRGKGGLGKMRGGSSRLHQKRFPPWLSTKSENPPGPVGEKGLTVKKPEGHHRLGKGKGTILGGWSERQSQKTTWKKPGVAPIAKKKPGPESHIPGKRAP